LAIFCSTRFRKYLVVDSSVPLYDFLQSLNGQLNMQLKAATVKQKLTQCLENLMLMENNKLAVTNEEVPLALEKATNESANQANAGQQPGSTVPQDTAPAIVTAATLPVFSHSELCLMQVRRLFKHT
jgi:hypothetical protein